MQAQLHNYFMSKNYSAKIECILLSLSSTARGQSMCEDLELRISCSLIQWLAGLLEGSAQWTKSCTCDNREQHSTTFTVVVVCAYVFIVFMHFPTMSIHTYITRTGRNNYIFKNVQYNTLTIATFR